MATPPADSFLLQVKSENSSYRSSFASFHILDDVEKSEVGSIFDSEIILSEPVSLTNLLRSTEASKENEKPTKQEAPVVHRKTGILSSKSYTLHRLLSHRSAVNIGSTSQTHGEPINQTAPSHVQQASNEENNVPVPSVSPMVSVQTVPISVQTVPQQNQPDFTNVQQPIDVSKYCNICNQSYSTKQGLRTHFKTIKHKSNSDLLQNILLGQHFSN